MSFALPSSLVGRGLLCIFFHGGIFFFVISLIQSNAIDQVDRVADSLL